MGSRTDAFLAEDAVPSLKLVIVKAEQDVASESKDNGRVDGQPCQIDGRLRCADRQRRRARRVVGSAFQLKDHSAALVLTHGVAPGWTAHANLGVTHDRSAHTTSGLCNLALERALTNQFDLAGEVYGGD